MLWNCLNHVLAQPACFSSRRALRLSQSQVRARHAGFSSHRRRPQAGETKEHHRSRNRRVGNLILGFLTANVRMTTMLHDVMLCTNSCGYYTIADLSYKGTTEL